MSLGPLMIDVRGTSLAADERDWLSSPLVAGVILFSRNFADPVQLQRLVDEVHALRSPPLLVAVDQEGGRVQRFREPFTALPALRSLGHLYDRDRTDALASARAFGWLMAAELRSVGIDLSFTPVVDLDFGLAQVIGDRALHADAVAVSELAVELVQGATSAGLAVTAKHFPSHAGALTDSHTEPAVDRRTFADLAEDLIPYRRLIARGLHAVMLAHVSFPAVDSLPAGFSAWWVGQLRQELGFSGAVVSDDVSMRGAAVAGGPADRVRAALGAGCDLVLMCNAPEQVPHVLETLEGYVDPPAQLRLMRLRGTHRQERDALLASDRWHEARSRIEALVARPALQLQG